MVDSAERPMLTVTEPKRLIFAMRMNGCLIIVRRKRIGNHARLVQSGLWQEIEKTLPRRKTRRHVSLLAE
jgi:hypothetical protein